MLHDAQSSTPTTLQLSKSNRNKTREGTMDHPHSLLVVLFLLFSPPLLLSSAANGENYGGCFDSSYDFASTVASALSAVSNLMSTISSFSDMLPDHRVTSAVRDCLELLDLSSDELNNSLFAVRNSGYHRHAAGSTGHRAYDLRTWLSGALSNQDTCAEGFKGTDGIIGNLVTGSLSTITSFVSEMLSNMAPTSGCGYAGNPNRKLLGMFPEWMGETKRRLLQTSTGDMRADVVVAADGSGDFQTVTEAVEAAPEKSSRNFLIYVKKGVYRENVDIEKKKWNIFMFGDGVGQTVITGNRNYVNGWTTFRSATLAVTGAGFIARGITFENSAGPEKHQAVALRSSADLSAFYQCEFRGYQDTLYAHSLRQFYRECIISGTVDFIFGNSATVFQDCLIVNRLPGDNQKNTVTAHGRNDPNQNTAFTLQGCNVTGEFALLNATTRTRSYLGRPWKEFARTVVMESYIGDVIEPEGWLAWNGADPPETIYYGEYQNWGPSSGLDRRVRWAGFHAMNDSLVAKQYTVGELIDGNYWLPDTGVKYTAGLRG